MSNHFDIGRISKAIRKQRVAAVRTFSVTALTVALGGAQASSLLSAEVRPPAGPEMGFLVSNFVMPIVPGLDACPDGMALSMRETYLESLSSDERERLTRKDREAELTRLWKAKAFGKEGANVCSQPELFERQPMKTVRHAVAWGMDLDKSDADTCPHDEFVDPHGNRGIDNQEYRVLGCLPGVRGRDGRGGELDQAYRQFLASGEWTQVLLLKGVDSLEKDDSVEVVYGNTPDRPVTDAQGRFLPGITYNVSDKAPRNRNVLKGRITNGVLETEPEDIVLTQTWGQGGVSDIRGRRTKFTFRKGRLRLTFQSDGNLRGTIGGYRPLFEEIQSPALGGAGSAIVAGIDCASHLATLRKFADGIRDPKTGTCTAVSSVMEITTVKAFVNDVRGK